MNICMNMNVGNVWACMKATTQNSNLRMKACWFPVEVPKVSQEHPDSYYCKMVKGRICIGHLSLEPTYDKIYTWETPVQIQKLDQKVRSSDKKKL